MRSGAMARRCGAQALPWLPEAAAAQLVAPQRAVPGATVRRNAALSAAPSPDVGAGALHEMPVRRAAPLPEEPRGAVPWRAAQQDGPWRPAVRLAGRPVQPARPFAPERTSRRSP